MSGTAPAPRRAAWLDGLAEVRRGRCPAVLVTALPARDGADGPTGVAKLVVGPQRTWGSLGSADLDRVAIDRAATVGADPATAIVCVPGGRELTLFLEPLQPAPAVAVFGLGHVGWELALLLSRHDLDLHLVDSRGEQFPDRRLAALADSVATIHTHHLPLLPEQAVGGLPDGTHVLVMTHDHAEDLAICDAALRTPTVATVGLIGSAGKAARFRRTLLADGLAAELGRLRCPVGVADLDGKEPAVLAVSIAAELLHLFAATGGVAQRVPRREIR